MRLESNQTHEEKRLIVNTERIKEIERIQKINELQNELSDLSEMGTDEEGLKESEIENLKREPLSIETETVKTILLSYGGGSDGFKLWFNQDKELLRGVYFMADWGEYQESDLTEEEAEEVYNFYMGGYYD